MPSTITAEKKALRLWAQRTEDRLSPHMRQMGDDLLLSRFLSLPQVKAANTILLYYGIGSEPETARLFPSLWAAGKQIFLPRCLPEHRMEIRLVQPETALVRHPYGMLEPGQEQPLGNPEQVELALVPGLAFDRTGNRLGRGAGCYDRWLASYDGFTLALCRDALLLDKVPCQPHDRPIRLVVTETGLYGLSAQPSSKAGRDRPAFGGNT